MEEYRAALLEFFAGHGLAPCRLATEHVGKPICRIAPSAVKSPDFSYMWDPDLHHDPMFLVSFEPEMRFSRPPLMLESWKPVDRSEWLDEQWIVFPDSESFRKIFDSMDMEYRSHLRSLHVAALQAVPESKDWVLFREGSYPRKIVDK